MFNALKCRPNVTDIKLLSDLDLGTNIIIKNSKDPTNARDLATKGYVDSKVSGAINVKDYGALGNGTTDDTTSINDALTYSGSIGGSIVYVPPGTYLINGALTVPNGVTLSGTNSSLRKGSFVNSASDTPVGSTFVVKNTNTGNTIVTLGYNSTLENIEFHYPDVNINSGSPTIYQFTISVPLNSHSCTIRNIQCNLCFNFLNILGDNCLIENIYGFPILKGIQYSNLSPVIMRNIIFNPNCFKNLTGSTLANYTLANGTAIEIFNSSNFSIDFIEISNYNICLNFPIKTLGQSGQTFGNISHLNLKSSNLGIVIRSGGINSSGLKISNGEINASTGILIGDTSRPNSLASEDPFVEFNNINVTSSGNCVDFDSNSRGTFYWISGKGSGTNVINLTGVNNSVSLSTRVTTTGVRINNSSGVTSGITDELPRISSVDALTFTGTNCNNFVVKSSFITIIKGVKNLDLICSCDTTSTVSPGSFSFLLDSADSNFADAFSINGSISGFNSVVNLGLSNLWLKSVTGQKKCLVNFTTGSASGETNIFNLNLRYN